MPSEPAPSTDYAGATHVDRLIEGVPVAVAAAVPTFLRARALHGTLDEAFGAFALAALLTFAPALLVLGAVRKGRDGVRALVGELSVAGVGMAVGAGVVVLAFWERLGAFLAHATHHRGLGGVAFAAGGLILAFTVSLVTRRAWPAVEAQGAAFATFVGVAGLFSPIALLTLGGNTPASPTDPLGLFVVDALSLLVVALAWVSQLAPAEWPLRARALLGSAAVLLVVAAAIHVRAPSDFPREAVAFAFRALPLR